MMIFGLSVVGCRLLAVRYWLLAVRQKRKMLRKMLFATYIALLRSRKCCGKCYLLPILHFYGAENVAENAICYPYHASNGVGNAAFTRHY